MSRNLMRRLAIGTLVGASTLTLVACGDKAPEGQVVATINGEEITLPEVNAEAQAANVPDGADKKEVMPALIQQIINRKLLVKVAKDKGIDKSPEFLIEKHRGEELLLAQMVAKQQISGLAVPTKAEIEKFIAENPTVFAERARYALDQIRFQRPSDPKTLAALQPAQSLDEVGAVLTKLGIKFERGPANLDSGSVPPQIMTRIKALSPSEPFVLPQGQLLTVNVVQASQPIAVPPEAAQQLAANTLRQQKAGKVVEATITAERNAAKITYQPGYAPPAEPAKPAAK